MNLNNFTIKAAEAIQQAQQLAYNSQNPNIETEHLLKALLDQEDSPVEFELEINEIVSRLSNSQHEELKKDYAKQIADAESAGDRQLVKKLIIELQGLLISRDK